MSQDDVLFGYRLQLVDLAGRIGVTAACRLFGVHRSTYYVWRRRIEQSGLGALRPRERRRPRMPNQLSPLVEQRIVAFALGHPGLGPRRIAAELAQPPWGGLSVSGNGVWRCLCRHGLNTRAKRLSLVAGYRAPYQPPRPAQAPRRVAADLQAAGWKLERVLTDNGGEFRGSFEQTINTLDATSTRIRAGRPQTNGAVESLHKTILEECWRPCFARYLHPRFEGLRRDLADYLSYYNGQRVHTGRLTQGRIPKDTVYGAHKWTPDEPHLSADLGDRPL
jgi:transposase InsO family protein